MNIFAKFKNGLKKSSTFLSSNIISSIKSNKISQDILDEIESVLISADMGLEVTDHLYIFDFLLCLACVPRSF